MRYAVLGDIHANLHAFEAVLEDARAFGCSEFHLLGDVVGYGAYPSECVDLASTLNGSCVLGNHDQAACGESLPEGFSAVAKASLEWTRERLSPVQKRWLGALRTQRQIRRTTFVHATLDSPLSWGYVREAADAEMSLALQRTPLCFIGHTHVPQAFAQGVGRVSLFEHPDHGVRLPRTPKYLINAGSVGQSRDGDHRAAYMIHDEEQEGLWMRRVEYDVEAAATAILEAALPEKLATRLRTGS
jgi:diadenosine tetraphosphatase ApaH/serine/threonine PP2A family protein phosphatase